MRGGTNEERLYLFDAKWLDIEATNMPDMPGIIARHKGRYHLAAFLARPGMKVLDFPCGSGYGAQILKEVGIKYVGADYDSETIEFAKSLDADVAQFMILIPYPGTEVREIIQAEGRILTDNWEEYGNLAGEAIFEHGELTKPLMEEMFKKAYRRFYYRPSYILKKILDIRSLNDIRLRMKGLSSVLKTTL